MLGVNAILVAETQLYYRLCSSIGPSVRPLVHVLIPERVCGRLGCGIVDGGWTLLPTRPQRYCDPAARVFSRGHATLHLAVSVGRSVGRSHF